MFKYSTICNQDYIYLKNMQITTILDTCIAQFIQIPDTNYKKNILKLKIRTVLLTLI